MTMTEAVSTGLWDIRNDHWDESVLAALESDISSHDLAAKLGQVYEHSAIFAVSSNIVNRECCDIEKTISPAS